MAVTIYKIPIVIEWNMCEARKDIHGLAIVKFSFEDLTSSTRTVNRQEQFYSYQT